MDSVFRQMADETVQKAATYLRADEILGEASRESWLGALYPPSKERGLKPTEIQVTPVEPRSITNAALAAVEMIKQTWSK